jgi:hypothetical protein
MEGEMGEMDVHAEGQGLIPDLSRAVKAAQDMASQAREGVKRWRAAGKPAFASDSDDGLTVHRSILGLAMSAVAPVEALASVMALIEKVGLKLPHVEGLEPEDLIAPLVRHVARSLSSASLDAIVAEVYLLPPGPGDISGVRGKILAWAPGLTVEQAESLAGWVCSLEGVEPRAEPHAEWMPEDLADEPEDEQARMGLAMVYPMSDLNGSFYRYIDSTYHAFCRNIGWLTVAFRAPSPAGVALGQIEPLPRGVAEPEVDDPLDLEIERIQRLVFETRVGETNARAARLLLEALAELPHPFTDEVVEGLAHATHDQVVARRVLMELESMASDLVALCQVWASKPRDFSPADVALGEVLTQLGTMPRGEGLSRAFARVFGRPNSFPPKIFFDINCVCPAVGKPKGLRPA